MKRKFFPLVVVMGALIAFLVNAAASPATANSISNGYTYSTGTSAKHTVSISATSTVTSSWTGYQTAKVSNLNARIARYSSSMPAAKQLRVDPNVKISGVSTSISAGGGGFTESSSQCSHPNVLSGAYATVLSYYEDSVVCTGGSIDLTQIDVSNDGSAWYGTTWYGHIVHAYHY